MQTPNITLAPVESSQIAALGHDAATNTLAIQFKNFKGEATTVYHYANFTAEQFAAFKSAESIGKHFAANIKHETVKHPYRKI